MRVRLTVVSGPLMALLMASSSIFYACGDQTQQKDVVLSQVKLFAPAEKRLDDYAERYEVIARDQQNFELIIPKAELAKLSKEQYVILEDDIQLTIEQLLDSDPEQFAGYHTFSEVEVKLAEIVANNPEIASLETYGQSAGNRPLYTLRLTGSDEKQSETIAKPKIVLTAATHGDELITVEVLLGLMDKLVQAYGQDPRLTDFIDGLDLYFIPVVNPDGFTKRSRYASGRDPNRDYPWPSKPNHDSVACIEALRNFYQQHQFEGSLDFHAHGRLIMYPWAYTHSQVDDNDFKLFHSLTKHMAQTNNYTYGQISKVIYIAKGSSADYYYWRHNTKAVAIEIGRSKVPPVHQIPGLLSENEESTWRFLESFIVESQSPATH